MYKKCYILCVLVLTLSVCCTGCSEKNKHRITAEAGESTMTREIVEESENLITDWTDENQMTEENCESIASDLETEEAGSELSEELIASIPELIMKVLLNEGSFTLEGDSYENLEKLFRRHSSGEEFSVIDFDSDGYNEVVLYNEPSYIFHTDGENVYAYKINFRCILWLKTDGIFNSSGGASDLYYHKFVEFTENEFVYETYLYIKGYMDGKKGPFYFDGVEDDKDTRMLTEEEGVSLMTAYSQEELPRYPLSDLYSE